MVFALAADLAAGFLAGAFFFAAVFAVADLAADLLAVAAFFAAGFLAVEVEADRVVVFFVAAVVLADPRAVVRVLAGALRFEAVLPAVAEAFFVAFFATVFAFCFLSAI